MNPDFPFRRDFFQAITDEPLEYGDKRYVPLYGPQFGLGQDPVTLLEEAILCSREQSVQLVSGFRGTGKTTELKRLEAVLIQEGYKVVYLNMDDYVNMSTPIDISDFLMALAGAFGEALKAPHHLGEDPSQEGYWDRLVSFFKDTKISLPEFTAVGIKANLKNDPNFRKDLQSRMEGHLGALVGHVRKFFAECIDALKKRHGSETQVVLLIDSLEHVRGGFSNAKEVQVSVEVLFTGHAEKLKFPRAHVVYSVPPYLKARSMNIGQLYGMGAVQIFPTLKIRNRNGGIVHAGGVQALKQVVAKRGDHIRLLGRDPRLIERLIMMSGGNIRDLLRLLAEVIRRATVVPATEDIVEDAINQMRTEFLPIADDDAIWLSEIASTHDPALSNIERLTTLARFFDTHVVLCYRDGPEWYDVHPLIKEHAIAQAAIVHRRRATASSAE